jgi:hypothetical protein
MSISKELFDKMLRAVILKDRINYTAGLLSELQVIIPFKADIEKFKRERCLALSEENNEFGVEPLTYEALLKEEILSAQSRTILMSGTDYDWNSVWEQRRYEIAKEMMSAVYLSNREDKRTAWNDSLPPDEIAKSAVCFADALIKELKTTKQ